MPFYCVVTQACRRDTRSLEAQGIERAPEKHLGPSAIGFERRTHQPSARRMDMMDALERLKGAREQGELERSLGESGVIDVSNSVERAKQERLPVSGEQMETIAHGMAAFRDKFASHKQIEVQKVQAREMFERYKAEQALLKQKQHEPTMKVMEKEFEMER